MGNKSTNNEKVEVLSFKKFLKTLTKKKIKELISVYNDDFAPEDKYVKGYSKLKKVELIDFLDKNIIDPKKSELMKEFEGELIEDLIFKATSLITGEHNVESIKNAAIIAGGKGFNVWYSSKYASYKASLQIDNSSVKRFCNCKIGGLGGLCQHQMAIYLMLLSKNIILKAQLPFKLEDDLYESVKKRLELHASQKLFKLEPSIVFEDGYKIYVNNDLITLEWTGDYPGKTTKDISKKEKDADKWLSQKVTDLILRNIKVRKKIGKPVNLVIDSYGIIPIIINSDEMVKKILRKFSVLENQDLPDNKLELETYLSENLKESSLELAVKPPFSAYEGNDTYIFVSYTHKDKSEVYPIIDKLHQTGLKLWYDEGIHLSTDWCNTIAEKLMDCRVVLCFISPNVNASENTKDEIFLATEENKPFIAVYLKNTDLEPGIKMRIRRIQGIMKYELDEKVFYDKLENNIKELVKQ
ncbi:MAG: TIR domain-containing protein [Candidatus Lokiarchaeota archaeon]|nr:TIR domain-containing protein [Candidatus Lokiarchaeota archaeon]MBD3201387.1 TIR domain-containing protein [Candidatus Lokiarchaeota archaeon]